MMTGDRKYSLAMYIPMSLVTGEKMETSKWGFLSIMSCTSGRRKAICWIWWEVQWNSDILYYDKAEFLLL